MLRPASLPERLASLGVDGTSDTSHCGRPALVTNRSARIALLVAIALLIYAFFAFDLGNYLTLGYIFMIGFWAKPLIDNKTMSLDELRLSMVSARVSPVAPLR